MTISIRRACLRRGAGNSYSAVIIHPRIKGGFKAEVQQRVNERKQAAVYQLEGHPISDGDWKPDALIRLVWVCEGRGGGPTQLLGCRQGYADTVAFVRLAASEADACVFAV